MRCLNYLRRLPESETLPNSFYEDRKMIQDLGLYYKKSDACVNDYILFWKEYANEDHYTICGISRWKSNKGKENFGKTSYSRSGKKNSYEDFISHFINSYASKIVYIFKKCFKHEMTL